MTSCFVELRYLLFMFRQCLYVLISINQSFALPDLIYYTLIIARRLKVVIHGINARYRKCNKSYRYRVMWHKLGEVYWESPTVDWANLIDWYMLLRSRLLLHGDEIWRQARVILALELQLLYLQHISFRIYLYISSVQLL